MLISSILLYFFLYGVGFLVTLWTLHKFKTQLDIDHYDPPHPACYDDYSSNAQAYATFSAMWPIFWILRLLLAFGDLAVKFSKMVGNCVGKNSKISSNQ